jgi:hypothetical protein
VGREKRKCETFKTVTGLGSVTLKINTQHAQDFVTASERERERERKRRELY